MKRASIRLRYTVLSALAFGACGTPTPAGRSVVPVGVAPPEPDSAAASPSATASASPSASATETPAALGQLLPARPTTPGKIQCESVDCDLSTEVCCVTEVASGERVERCVPKPSSTADASQPWVCGDGAWVLERDCDEAADCPIGQACCAPMYDESNLKHEYCGTSCGDERCLAGSKCPNGNECKVKDGERAGECPLEIKPPKCGSKTCALGQRCCWDRDAQRGSCAESCGDESAWFACTSPEQCAGSYTCNTWPGATQFRCGGSGFQGAVLCRTVRDCPEHLSALGVYDGAPRATGCKHAKELPPGVKECVYE